MPTATVYRYAGAVPPPLLAALKRAFAPSAPFWSETGYEVGSYYSYYFSAHRPSAAAACMADGCQIVAGV